MEPASLQSLIGFSPRFFAKYQRSPHSVSDFFLTQYLMVCATSVRVFRGCFSLSFRSSLQRSAWPPPFFITGFSQGERATRLGKPGQFGIRLTQSAYACWPLKLPPRQPWRSSPCRSLLLCDRLKWGIILHWGGLATTKIKYSYHSYTLQGLYSVWVRWREANFEVFHLFVRTSSHDKRWVTVWFSGLELHIVFFICRTELNANS